MTIPSLDDLGKIIAERYREYIRSNDLVASKTLLSFSVETEIRGDHYMVYFNLPDYYKFAEMGVNGSGRDGNVGGKYQFKNGYVSRAMVDSIKQWIVFKRLVPSGSKGIKTNEQLAWAISKDIKKKGIKPRHALQDALYDSIPEIAYFMDKFAKTQMNDIIEELWNE